MCLDSAMLLIMYLATYQKEFVLLKDSKIYLMIPIFFLISKSCQVVMFQFFWFIVAAALRWRTLKNLLKKNYRFEKQIFEFIGCGENIDGKLKFLRNFAVLRDMLVDAADLLSHAYNLQVKFNKIAFINIFYDEKTLQMSKKVFDWIFLSRSCLLFCCSFATTYWTYSEY